MPAKVPSLYIAAQILRNLSAGIHFVQALFFVRHLMDHLLKNRLDLTGADTLADIRAWLAESPD